MGVPPARRRATPEPAATGPAPHGARRTEPIVFAAACAVAALAFQGTRGLWDTDEGRYAEATREMLAAGRWLTPMLEGRAHLTKPPGAYWATALGITLLGIGEWGARLFLGVAFGLSAWCVRHAGRGILGEAGGARAGWCYLGMLYAFVAGSVLSTDTFLAAAIAASVACSATSLVSPRPGRWHLAAGAALGAAFLVKGHVALLSWGGFVAGWAVAGRRAFPGRRIVSAPGVALSLVPIGAWLAALHAGVEGGLGRVLDEAAKHVSDGDHGGKPLWYYPAIVVAGTTPWWVQVAGGMRRLRFAGTGAWLAVWAGAAFAGYSLVPTRMALYLLPLCVPLALWAGAREPRDPRSPLPWPAWALGGWLALLCAARGAAALLPTDRDMGVLARAVAEADPSGTLPVATFAGADMQGLHFYLGERVRRVQSEGVRNDRASRTLAAERDEHDSRREPWILVAEARHSRTERAIAETLGPRAADVGAVRRWRILRVEPKAP